MRNREYLYKWLVPVLLIQWVSTDANINHNIIPTNVVQSLGTNTVYLPTTGRIEAEDLNRNEITEMQLRMCIQLNQLIIKIKEI